ncbi:MAG: GTPase ObgE [Gaiella sp.]
MFHDRATLTLNSGRGGDGGLSFRREKHVPRGGPDGGDGGRGGDVRFRVDARLRDLSSFQGKTRFSAEKGGNGRGTRKHGADGASLELRVPVGTQVWGADGELLVDLAEPGQVFTAARGGQGGRGNAQFATPTRQTPRFAEIGQPGESRQVELQLKLMADAALAGLPNAGKSSLLRRISNARPKVAAYPFTTLQPVLGTVNGPDGRQLTVADVPGLIEGASDGVGLGHDFLAHLERARLLVHVIDGSAGDADERFGVIDRELSLYGAGLEERPQLVVLNKADLSPDEAPFTVRDARIQGVYRVSCVTGAGIDGFLQALFARCPEQAPAPAAATELPEFMEYRPAPRPRRPFRIYRTDRGFRVIGDTSDAEAVEGALRLAGVKTGALVEVGGEELEWG